MPNPCNFSTPAAATVSALIVPNAACIRPQMVAWARMEICWPTIW